MSGVRYPFASPGWMAFMHGMIRERASRLFAEAPGVGWSICEVFTDPPPELSPTGRPIAWHVIVRDGEVSFGDTETDAAEIKIVADYAAVLPLGRFDTRGDPARAAELGAMSRDLIARGLMTVVGDRSRRDPRIGDFHDAIARVTA
ncbi:MAG: hypothetical protein GC203_11865 [Phenylobacterium sp.]|uniref:hypothetical protein n=1 Tax=Phenylobacterium sp. TaxID=1871053 RepID=UPI0025E5577C|nr:hypothetical protein [Phenylobacterium sp.]MBI1198550.1 hypothetical protein [Phenylobacterium sp.]